MTDQPDLTRLLNGVLRGADPHDRCELECRDRGMTKQLFNVSLTLSTLMDGCFGV